MSNRHVCTVFTFYASDKDTKKALKIIKDEFLQHKVTKIEANYLGKKKLYALMIPTSDGGDYSIKHSIDEVVERLRELESYFAISQIGDESNLWEVTSSEVVG